MGRPRQVGITSAAGATAGLAVQDRVVNTTPTAGQTVTMTADAVNETAYLTPAGTLATLTVTLPANATSRIGQFARILTTQTLTVLTVNGATTIVNNPTTLVAGTSVSFQKLANDTWGRV